MLLVRLVAIFCTRADACKECEQLVPLADRTCCGWLSDINPARETWLKLFKEVPAQSCYAPLLTPQIENLESQALLQELWLGRNRISTVQNLDHLKLLRRISLQVDSGTVTKHQNQQHMLKDMPCSC